MLQTIKAVTAKLNKVADLCTNVKADGTQVKTTEHDDSITQLYENDQPNNHLGQ